MSDQQIHDLLHDTVAGVVPANGGWDDVERRARAADAAARRRRFTIIVAAAAAVAGVLAGVAVLNNDDGRTRVDLPAGTPETTVEEAVTVPTTRQATGLDENTAAGPVPPTFVGTRDGSTELVVASSSSGRTVRVLADYGPPVSNDEGNASNIIGSLALSADGVWVYFSTGPEPMGGQLRRVRVAGGPVEDLGRGEFPALSPDNRTLAYAVDDAVVFRDLGSGRERRYTQPGVIGFSQLAWTKGSDGLVVATVSEGSSAWYVVNASLIDPPRRIGPRDPKRIWTDVSVRYSHDGLVGFIETCCAEPANGDGAAARELVLVDPATGETLGRTPLGVEALHMEYDASGQHVVLIDSSGRAQRRSGEPGKNTVIADGFSLADW